MHYRMEVVLPNVADVETAIAQILEPFSEHNEDAGYTFWDWYVIGGRWSGIKLEESLDQENLAKFREKLKEMKVTVSGLRFGKDELQPSSQIPKVDSLWREFFPNGGESCPFFKHSNNQSGDILAYKDVPQETKCERLIFAGLSYDGKEFEAKEMFQTSFWNSVSHVQTTWDGKFATAASEFHEKLKGYSQEYAEKITPKDDWLVVTVDYHS
jgi:hypothetical protein